jgi:hypothetical protein
LQELKAGDTLFRLAMWATGVIGSTEVAQSRLDITEIKADNFDPNSGCTVSDLAITGAAIGLGGCLNRL